MQTRTAESYKQVCDNVLLKRGKNSTKMTELKVSKGGSVSFFKNARKKKLVVAY